MNDDRKPYTLLLLDAEGNVVLNRLVLNPRIEHTLDEVQLQVQNRTTAGLPIRTSTSDWFVLKAKLVRALTIEGEDE